MIIHSYLTDGFYGWAEIFIESFRFHHGDEHRIVLTTRDLTEEQIESLYSLYPNLEVINRPLNLKKIATRARMSESEILELKNHIENSAVTNKTFIWKQAISVEDRYRSSILETMKKYPKEDYLIHFDIDMYFRKNLKELFEIVRNHDISIKFRLKSKLNRKVMGGLIGFKLQPQILNFMKRWIQHIDSKPLYEKPLGYGQTSFYLTYQDYFKILKWGNIPSKFISPRFLEHDVIWSGNTEEGKAKNLLKCRKDFNKIRRQKNAHK